MKNNISQKALSLLILISLIIQLGCKKNDPNPNNTSTIAKVLYFTDSKIMVVNADGSNAHAINITLPDHVILDQSSPRISPDGSTVFFNAHKTDNNNITISHDIYSYKISSGATNLVASSNSNQTTNNICSVYTEQQQTKVLYTQAINGGQVNIKAFIANADGTNVNPINIVFPSNVQLNSNVVRASADGKSIYFTGQSFYIPVTNPTPTLYMANIDGTNVKQITTTNFAFISGDYLEGALTKIFYIDFVLVAPNNTTIQFYNINTDGTNKQPINITLPSSVQLSLASTPVISKDGKVIYFSAIITNSPGNYSSSIYSSNIDGTNPKMVISGNSGSSLVLGDVF